MSTNSVRPIDPRVLVERLRQKLPSPLIEAVNELIEDKFTATSASFSIVEVQTLLAKKGFRSTITEKQWANIVPVFELDGWDVDYIPLGNETYIPGYKFNKSKK